MDLEQLHCVEFVELVTDYRERALDSHGSALFEEHAVSCYPCSMYRAQVEQTIVLLNEVGVPLVDPGVRDRLLRTLDLPSDESEVWYEPPVIAREEPSPPPPSTAREPTERAFKFLKSGRVSPFAGHRWEPPREDGPGAWVETDGALSICERGIHACRLEDLPYWLDDELWVIEVAGVAVEHHHKLVARRGRLVRRVEAWTPRAARALAHACTLRARRHAAEALRRRGRREDAARLMRCRSFAAIQRVGLALAEIHSAAGYAADVAEAGALRGLHPLTADMAAYTAGVAADSADAYDAERRWQAEWLSRELGLGRR